MSDSNRSIKCRVESCKHHDKNEYCTLTDIVVGQQCGCKAKECSETECLSFDCR